MISREQKWGKREEESGSFWSAAQSDPKEHAERCSPPSGLLALPALRLLKIQRRESVEKNHKFLHRVSTAKSENAVSDSPCGRGDGVPASQHRPFGQ